MFDELFHVKCKKHEASFEFLFVNQRIEWDLFQDEVMNKNFELTARSMLATVTSIGCSW